MSGKEGSHFEALKTIDYGSDVSCPKVPEDEMNELWKYDFPEYGFSQGGFSRCELGRFMAWFHLPSVQFISIWLGSFDGVITQENQGRLSNVHILVLSRSTFPEQDLPSLLSQMTWLKSLHLGKAYERAYELALKAYPSILEGFPSVSNTLGKLSLVIEYIPESEKTGMEFITGSERH